MSKAMSIIPAYIEIAETIAAQIALPAVTRLYLPELDTGDEFRDEFGLLFLEGGVVAPFYASLPGTLGALRQRFPANAIIATPLLELIELMAEQDLASRALGLGAYNAMSQYLMQGAGLLPLKKTESGNMGAAKPRPGEQVGMIGYFCPLIDKLVDRGCRVLVLEQQPERVPERPGVRLTQNPADLSSCRIILCTAATLINDSIDNILANCRQAESFSLIGPSGSGLPDVLLERGVDAVGGVYFSSDVELQNKLAERSSWGSAGQKYQLTADIYPGYQALLDKMKTRLSDT